MNLPASPIPASRTTTPPTPEELRAWDRQHVWHAFSQMAEYEPFIVREARGATLIDLEGRSYIDAVSSLWCNVHGHRHPRLDEAIRRQLEQVAHVTSLGMAAPATIELAKRLTEIAPAGLNHVFFSSDGASSVEAALKIAFQYWRQTPNARPGKTKFAALHEAYHGDTLGGVSVGGVDRFTRLFGPLLFAVERAPAPDLYRLPEGVAPGDALGHYLGRVEELLRRHHHELAALVIEPLVQCAAGILTHPPGFLRGVRDLTRRHDVLLVADEVATGFGRTGAMFACQHEDVAPDLLCLGKGLTGGYLPLAATLAADEIWNAFLGTHAESKTFFHGHTYTGNPLACAAALANLAVFDEEQTLAQLPPKIDRLTRMLAGWRGHRHVGDTRQVGLIGGVELVRDKATREPFSWEERRAHQVCDEARRRGAWLRPLGNVIIIMPPLTITLAELDRVEAAISAGLATL